MNGEPSGEQWDALHREGVAEFAEQSSTPGITDRTYFGLHADSESAAKKRVAAALGVGADELAIHREGEGWRWRPLPS
jgi:hypothetical protein